MANGSFFQNAVEKANKKSTTAVERLAKAYNDNTQSGSASAVETPVLDNAVKQGSKQAFSPASSLEEFMGVVPYTDENTIAENEWKRMGVDNAQDYAKIRTDYASRGLKSGVVGASRDIVNYLYNLYQQAKNNIAKGNQYATGDELLYQDVLKKTGEEYKDTPLEKAVHWGEAYDQESERIAQELGVNEEARKDYQFNQALGRMAPAIAVSMTGNLAGAGFTALGAAEAAKGAYAVGRFLSSAATFTSAAGGAYEDAKAHGIDDDQAMTYAAAVGAIELAAEAFSSGLGKIGGKKIGTGGFTDDFIEGLAKKVSSDQNVQNAIIYVGGVVGEGFEEWLSEWGDYAANRLLVGYDDRTLKDVWGDSKESFYQGAMMSSLLNITQLIRQGTPPKDAIKQGVDETAAEAGISPTEQVSPAAQAMARAATQNSVQETAPAQTEVSPAAQTMADVLTGKNANMENPYSSGDYSSTYTAADGATIRKDAKTFRNVVAGIDTSVKDFFSRWKNGRKSHLGEKLEKLYLGKVTDAARQRISELLGYDVTSENYIITSDGVKHVFDQHGDAGKETARGNIPLTDDIIEKLPEVLANPDSIDLGHQESRGDRNGIVFQKAFPNGTIVYIQFDNSGRGTIEGKTIYAKKAATSSGVNADASANTFTSETTEPVAATGTDRPAQFGRDLPATGSSSGNVQALPSTSETTTTIPVGNQNVSQATANVNTEGVETRLSQTAETVRDAGITPDAVKQDINTGIENGKYRYIPESNADAVASARASIKENGYDSVLRSWTAEVARGKTSNDLFATGAVLYNEAIQSGNTKLALDILTDYQMLGTNTAQGLQAASIIKNLSPDGRLYIMQQDVKKLNDSLSETAKRKAAPKTKDADVTATVREAKTTAAKKTAEKIAVDEKYNDMIFTFEYGQEATDQLERYVRNEARRQMLPNKTAPTAMESLVGSIKRFARQKFLDGKKKASPTSLDLLTEYVQNQAFFDEVWHNAQKTFDNLNDTATREYAGRFTKDGILDNSKNNKFLQQAVYESAIASDETAAMIAKQAQLMPPEKIAESLANDLIAKTGATGDIDRKIRNATATYVTRIVEKNAGKTSSGKIVKGGVAELGQTFREIASQPNATKEQIRQDLADQLAMRYAVSPETAKRISDTVMAEYDTQLHEAMTAEVKKRFAPKDVNKTGEKAVVDKIIEAVNLGTFDTEYASAAAEKLFGSGDVRIDPELADAFINAKDAAARDAAVTAIQQDIASQIPASFAEKWRALRYLNMLGNVKTQVRNLLGNTAMMGLTGAKNTMLTGVEYLANKLSGGKYERNTAFGVRDYLDAAKKYYSTVNDYVNGDSKYMESNLNDSFSRGIQDARQIFGFKPLEAYRKATQWAMTQGDVLFIRPQFARSLSGYLKARGMDANTFTQIVNGDIQATTEQQNLIHNATEYAAREAQEATFHDSNAISDAVSKVGKGWPAPVRAIFEGILPFRKTPANVLVRAEEYSPLGVVNTAVNAYQAAKGLNGKTAADVINSFSKTATGTSLFALGALLAKAGLARGAEDDEEQAAFDKMQGKQDFSVVLPDGSSYTIDWLSPASVPFFMGVAFSDAMADGDITIGEFLKAIDTLTEPMIDMSMLQGVNDALDQIKYADNALVNFALNQMVNYASQGIGNSLFGQIERITEKNRETTYTESDTPEGRTWERTLGKVLNKIPGIEYNQVEYVDAWGRTQSNGSVVERAFSNLLSPGYIGKNRSTEVDNELQRLYDAGQTNVFPSRISMTDTVGVYRDDGRKLEDRRLTKDEYVQYQKVMGQTSLELVKDLMKSPVYQGMSDEAKAAAISEIYGYAKRMAAMAVEPSAKYGEKTDVSKLSNPAAYYATNASFNTASKDSENRNYGELDFLTASFSRLPKDVQDAVTDGNAGFSKLLDARENGYTARQYYNVYDTVKALTPADGYTNVATWQKIDAVCSMNVSDKEKDYFVGNYFTDGAYSRYQSAREAGYSPYSVSVAYQTYQLSEGVDKNGDGKADSGTKKAAFISAMMAQGASKSSAEWLYKLFSSNK